VVQRSGSASRKTERQEMLLDASRMGCGETREQRKTRKGGMDELETKVTRKSIQKEVLKRLKKRTKIHRSQNKAKILWCT